MTPKEMAFELVFMFDNKRNSTKRELAKKQAFIMTNHIMHEINSDDDEMSNVEYQYWKDRKREIE